MSNLYIYIFVYLLQVHNKIVSCNLIFQTLNFFHILNLKKTRLQIHIYIYMVFQIGLLLLGFCMW